MNAFPYDMGGKAVFCVIRFIEFKNEPLCDQRPWLSARGLVLVSQVG